MRIAAVGRALPKHYYSQEQLTAALSTEWSGRHHNLERLQALHRHVLVGGRHLALPIDDYAKLTSFGATNDAFIACAVELGEHAIRDALQRASLQPTDIDHIFFVSVTGLAVPSIDARMVNRLGLRPDIKRTPIFGLGCVAGAAGVARAADYLRGFPTHTALVLSVELCSLTLQRQDLSIANIIASGLFGDGAAAALLVGAQHPTHAAGTPRVVASQSVFYPDTERVMGWDITEAGFRVVLSADVPQVVEKHIARNVDQFLALHDLGRADMASFVCHPGGPKVMQAFCTALNLPEAALEVTRRSLATLGNLSSASVLLVLRDTLLEHRPPPGSYGLMMAMGPGFCAELVLLQW